MKINYQLEMEKMIKAIEGRPRLLLHSCCAPCSSAVIEQLAEHFELVIYYYNPNIEPEQEYKKRLEEQRKLIEQAAFAKGVHIVAGEYENDRFRALAAGVEDAPEGGTRCRRCIGLRLEETAARAKENGCDYFTTTLSVSPHKDAEYINKTGVELEEKYGVKYLFGDFKKKEGYKRSIELSKKFGLYRQEYCGCLFARHDVGGNNE